MFRINQILGQSYFSLIKFDLFGLVSLQTMIGMRMVEREADGQVGGGQKTGDKHRWVYTYYSITVHFAP